MRCSGKGFIPMVNGAGYMTADMISWHLFVNCQCVFGLPEGVCIVCRELWAGAYHWLCAKPRDIIPILDVSAVQPVAEAQG